VIIGTYTFGALAVNSEWTGSPVMWYIERLPLQKSHHFQEDPKFFRKKIEALFLLASSW
jgi:hypothetical protein